MKMVLASGNQGKLNEFQALFAPHEIVIRPQSEFNIVTPEETGLTFVENALIKARAASRATGLPALADDSGLAIDALKGAPGIYSARFAGNAASDRDNIIKALDALDSVPESQRTAQFHCVLVLLRHAEDPTPLICHGEWQGRILTQIQGDGGFGYDPIFWSPEHQCSAAELSREQKNAISHRGKALQQLLTQLDHFKQTLLSA